MQSIIQDLQLTFLPFRYRTLPSIKSILRDLVAEGTENHTELVDDPYGMRTQGSCNIPLRIVRDRILADSSECYDIFRTPI